VVPIVFLVLLVVAFLIGSVPFAFLFVRRMKGIDIRTQGSGNVGATNAARVLGKPMGIFILLLDVAKGAFAAWVLPFALQFWIEHMPLGLSSSAVLTVLGLRGTGLCMGIAAFLGHCYSPFLGFRGGKGVATALGVYLVVAPKATLVTLAVCVTIILVTRVVSLASLVGAVLLPILIVVFYWSDGPWGVVGVTVALSATVVFRHRANIRRLLAGQELKH
jgi:glycerol-3-phosphate acyltransferase PlsY